MIIFNSKNDDQNEKNEKLEKYDFQPLAGWDEHNAPTFKFQLRNGEDLCYSTDCQQDFFVQTGGVVPPILYLESFCSWFRFLSNHHFHFVVVYFELVEASNIKSH